MLRNTIWNLLGEGLPMLAALLSIPLLVGGIGLERFGALTLVWALLGWLMVLDLGLARALIQTVAERRGRRDGAGVAGIVRPALALMGLVGVAGGAVVAAASGPLAGWLAHGSALVAGELRTTLFIVAAIVPVALVSAALRGVLEAHQEFRRVNLVKMTVGVLNYLSPVAVLPFTDSLAAVIAAIAAGRLAGAAAYGWLCLRVVPGLASRPRGPREPLRPLFTLGAWMTLNNLLGPLMTYADRFVLAGLVPVAAVAFYTTPFELVVRLLFIPAALSGVLFPTAAGLFRQEPAALRRILDLGVAAIAGVFLPVLAAAVLLGGPALDLWLGPAFAAQGGPVLAVLALGVLFNAMAYVPYALIHGTGRMDVTAWLQLAELPVYLGALWLLVGAYGPLGAAIAWTARTGVDLLLLLLLFGRLAPGTAPAAGRLALAVTAVGGLAAAGLAVGGGEGLLLLAAGILPGLALAGRRLWASGRGLLAAAIPGVGAGAGSGVGAGAASRGGDIGDPVPR
ncbi:flippase [Azospirillum sp. RWY-5-1]|uniref:Flippase n=1 Tax=Azospirillum oleiclasticum TaxID=2735135 RepID=A0ABX2TML7_9PROT|nr:flippase [Azospirillum oleiclasticum]NYZ24648.1 flippase [Azospirillum oleiclasticum]